MPRSKRTPTIQRNVALCYIRKSWTREEKDTTSPERQRAHIQAVCDTNGWIPEWHEDIDGHRSGMHENNRPGWLALKARMSEPDVVAIVANDLARLHRKGWRVGDLLDFVDKHGIKLILADPSRELDFSSPYGRIMAQLCAVFDEWYAQDISTRWKADIAYRKSRGITVGLPPFGTRRNKDTGYLEPTNEGAWLLPDGTWLAGREGDLPPMDGASWRGYFELTKRILSMYANRIAGRTRIAEMLQAEGWAFKDRKGNPTPLETDDIRRVTNNWPEYGGAVIGSRARERHPDEYDPNKIELNPERAVFDVELLREVGRVQRERTVRKTKRGRPTAHPYPLGGLVYCTHCEELARVHNNPKLRSKLGGKSQQRYRHLPGVPCGCQNKSILRETLEDDFMHMVKLLSVKPEMTERIKTMLLKANGLQNEAELRTVKETAIAKCYRRIEAARNLYADGEITRDEYLLRKDHNEQEITRWETTDTDAERLLAELTMAVEAVNKIAQLWEISSDEDKQGMAKMLFESITYDLDRQCIVDFRLKAWAEQFFVLRTT